MAGSEVSKRSNGGFQFNIKASNSQVIGTSETYADEGGCDNDIASVKSNAPAAAVNDQTDR